MTLLTERTTTVRHLLRDTDLSRPDYLALLELAESLKLERSSGKIAPRLIGREVAVIFEKPSTRTRSAFEVALHEEGAGCTYMDSASSHLGSAESFSDTARVLSRFYDGIAYRGFAQSSLEALAESASVPVWNALTDTWHPTQALADMLTMRETARRPLEDLSLCFLGDGRNNVARSLLTSAAILGMDMRIAAPPSLQPPTSVMGYVRGIAARSGASIMVTDDIDSAVKGVDFVYTDVWVSMGEPDDIWDERVRLLKPYRVDKTIMQRTGNRQAQFLHCLPSIHDRTTDLGRRMFERYGLEGAEVSDEVFTSPASRVFDQAENRMHTIKAVILNSLADDETPA